MALASNHAEAAKVAGLAGAAVALTLAGSWLLSADWSPPLPEPQNTQVTDRATGCRYWASVTGLMSPVRDDAGCHAGCRS